jgi:putative DNA primase/helicase
MVVDPRIRFEDVAAAALANAHTLLPKWMGGEPHGNEWHGARKANGGPGDSWKVNLKTGHWGAFAGDGRGKDLVSLYAELHHIESIEALPVVAEMVGMNGSSIPVLPARNVQVQEPDEGTPLERIPADAGALPEHRNLGSLVKVHTYGDEFVVCRFENDKGKTFLPYRWRNGKWWNKAAPSPKRLFNIEQLSEHHNAPVLVVEGEKCVEALRPILDSHVVITWAGGASAVKKSRWNALEGRNVVIWPDADKPGLKAAAEIKAALHTIAKSVRVVTPPADVPEGWDLADGIESEWDAARITEWLKPPAAVVKPASTIIESGDYEESAMIHWSQMGLDSNQDGQPHPTMANTSRILQLHPRFKGHVWYDEFTNKVCHDLHGDSVIWGDIDDEDLTIFMQQSLRLPKFNLQLVRQAVRPAARCFRRHPLREWLDSLKWDGNSILDDWLVDCLGIEKTEYTIAVSNKWPISMVARAYRPGCKADTMPVLEGVMGTGKSSFLDILGSPWYASLPDAFGPKLLDNIRGRWLVEVPDMSGFSSRDHQHILAILTTRTDIDRVPYDKHSSEFPRSCIFAGTSETDDYLQDTLGSRRYWPLRCKDIDTDVLHRYRDRVFAEAVVRYRENADYWTMPDSAAIEQQRRAPPDEWTAAIINAAEREWSAGNPVVASRLLTMEPLHIPLGKQTISEQRRAGKVLRRAGWEWKHTNTGGIWIKRPLPT